MIYKNKAALVAAIFSLGGFSGGVAAAEKGELETTTIEAGYSRLNTEAQHMQPTLALRLRNETVDGWYVDLSGSDSNFTFIDDLGGKRAVDYTASARLGKSYNFGDKLSAYAGVNMDFVKIQNGTQSQVEEGVGGHVGTAYQWMDNLEVSGDLAYLEWAGDQTLQLSAMAKLDMHKHAYMAVRVKEMFSVNVNAIDLVYGLEF